MANLKVNNYDNLYLRLNGDEYWDFYVNKDSYGSLKLNGLYDDCLISYIDLCDTECTDGSEWLYSKSGYTWDKSLSVGHTLYNISFTNKKFFIILFCLFFITITTLSFSFTFSFTFSLSFSFTFCS